MREFGMERGLEGGIEKGNRGVEEWNGEWEV